MEECVCCSLSSPTPELIDMPTTWIEPAVSVSDAYLLCSGLSPPSEYPAKLCQMCLDLLKDVHNFYKMHATALKAVRKSKGRRVHRRCEVCRLDHYVFCEMRSRKVHNLSICDAMALFFGRDVASIPKTGLMCTNCIAKLEKAFTFREFCKDANEILKRRKVEIRVTVEPDKSPDYKPAFDTAFLDDAFDDYDEPFDDYDEPLDDELSVKEEKFIVKPQKPIPAERVINLFECGVCGIKAKRKYELMMHLFALHFPEWAATLHRCKVCSKMYKNEQKKNDHEVRRHSEIKEKEQSDDILLCNSCGQRFRHPTKLREHIMAKHVVKDTTQFTCKYCSIVYTHRRTFERHIRDKHEGGQNRCEQCGRCFTQPVYLERHKRTHQRELFVCKTCGKQFSATKQLKLHEFDHMDYRPYNCPELTADGVLCGFTAKKKASFVFHLHKQHAIDYNEHIHGTKNNVELAKKMFREKTLVKQKVLTHDCKFCGRAFQTATGLLHHKQADHLKISFHCKFCEKTFTQKAALWDHSFKHRDFFPFNCSHCDYRACNKKVFQTHLKRLHNKNYEEDVHGYKKETFQQVMDFVLKKQ